ncbi:MAG TPA: amino acid adenylation domain-containing protein, partial [Longimicrobium sp.]|nr:amino acid adenylation domain-containing protein [Longimicrobium sp.]
PGLPHATVDALFARAAAAAPEAVALAWDGGRMTYAELDERANRLAHHLRRAGVAAGTRVGVCLERGPEMVVATLAALKAGGAYVPLDPAYPAERLAFMLADTAVSVLVTESSLTDRLPAHAARVIQVDADAAAIAAEPADALAAPDTGTDPEAPAYVMYTSGSTGRPKGVEVPHRAIVRLVRGQDYLSIDPSDVFLQLAPASFDAATLELWGPLLNGARLAIHPAGQPSVESIGRALEEHGVTVLWLTAGLFHLVVEERIGVLRGVRQLLAGGDVLSVPHVRRVLAELPETALINGYGPTENTTFTCCHRIGAAEDGISIPVGRPIANTYVRVLDAGMQPAPMGVPGELYAGGAGLALGYLNRPELTAEKFVADPYLPGARLYRTGDRVRWMADGTLEFMGRVDTQVKIRGFRIELGEIETALRQSPGVRDCTVVVRDEETGGRRLVAYVVGEAEADALRDRLRLGLPEYMLPSAFVFLDALPLTANGKLDRKALPAPEEDAYARGSYEAPLGEVEAALAEIWSELLGVERVGRRDHFFELGGHSLLAIKLIERMRRAGLHMEVRALFTTPVLAELALAVGGASAEIEVPANGIPEGSVSITPEMLPLVELSQAEIDRIVAEVPGGAANVQDIYPLAPLQEGILFHHLLSEEGDPYLLTTVTEFDTRARLDQYLAALQAVIDRHDILRTAVVWDGLREPVQVVVRHAPLTVEEVELDGGEEDAAERLWRRHDPRRYRMDLTRAPLLRASIAEDRARGRWLLLTLRHHLTSDHESQEVLQAEIAAHLRGLEAELPAPLPFRNYVAQARLGVSREEHERFFTDMLADVEEPTAPYGLLDVQGEGRGIRAALLPVEGELSARL